MAFTIGKLKCYFCKSKYGLLHSVHGYGIYGEAGARIHYHSECLEMIEIDPELFGHKMMDKAININELKKENVDKFNGKLANDFKKKVDKLHQLHFERMMPRK